MDNIEKINNIKIRNKIKVNEIKDIIEEIKILTNGLIKERNILNDEYENLNKLYNETSNYFTIIINNLL